MNKITVELNEQRANPAINHREIEVELNFDTDDPQAKGTVTVNNWDWSVEEAKLINQHIADGKMYEGIPFKIFVEDEISRAVILDAYLDTAAADAEYECDRVKLPSKLRGGVDWLNDSANFTYSLLFEKKEITTADYIAVPYIISSIPNRSEIMVLTLTGFVIVMQIATVIKDLTAFIKKIVSLTAATGIINLILYVVFLVILVVALIKLIKDLVRAIIQPVKFHSAMKLRTLLDKGAAHLKMKFKSTIFDNDDFWNNAIVLPAKFKSFEDSDGKLFGSTKPIPTIQTGYFDGTFADLLRICKTMFNAKIVVFDNVIQLERIDTNTSVERYIMPPVEVRKNKTNASDLKTTLNLSFTPDQTETNTIDNWKGTVTDISTFPTSITKGREDMVLSKDGDGLSQKRFDFSRGTKKLTLTNPEQFFDNILQAFCPILSKLTNIINRLRKLSKKYRKKTEGIKKIDVCDLIKVRIGMLSLSDDFFTQTKLIGFDQNVNDIESNVSDDNSIKINSEFIYLNFYKVLSMVPSKEFPNANHWLRFNARIPFCKEDFDKIVRNNIFFDNIGQVAKIESLKWRLYQNWATINWRVNKLFSVNFNGLEEFINTPDGQ